MISTNQIAYFKRSAVVLKMMNRFVVYDFVSPRACIVYSEQKVKASEIL